MQGPGIGAVAPWCHLRRDVCVLHSANIHVSAIPPFIVQDGCPNSKSRVLTGQCPKQEGRREWRERTSLSSPFSFYQGGKSLLGLHQQPSLHISLVRTGSYVQSSPTSSKGEEDWYTQFVDQPWNQLWGLSTMLPEWIVRVLLARKMRGQLMVSTALLSSLLQVVWPASGGGVADGLIP